jgi:uncharacterized protein (DUF885 family)
VNTVAPSPDLERLAADYWESALEANPVGATAIGDRRYDDRLPDPSAAGTSVRLRQLEALAARAGRFDAAVLGPADRVTLSALREVITAERLDLQSGLLAWNVDPLDGLPTLFLNIPAFQRLETPEDGRRMVARWREMATYLDRSIESLLEHLEHGIVACVAPVDRTISILDDLLASPDAEWPLLAPLRTQSVDGWSTADRERFTTDLTSSITDGVRPGFERLRMVLVERIRPAARPPERPGMRHVQGGLDAYRMQVRRHTSLDLDPEAVHRTGLEEIARIDGELAALAGRVTGAASLREALAGLRTDPGLHFRTGDEVFETAARSLARALEATPAWFGRLPEAPCEVVRMGAHEQEHSTIAYYRQPAADGSRPGQYYINTSHPETRPRYEAEVLAFHEAVPGHHLQIAIAQELEALPAFRRHLGPTAYIEGWGLYIERLAEEMGLYSGDLDRIGVLSYDAWRASRLVVDTGMHALGWSRDRAVAFMLEHTALAPNNIENEVDRYISLPAQALAYKTGQLELLRLRAGAEARLGAAFDIRGFHDLVLGDGALPLGTLRELVEGWQG